MRFRVGTRTLLGNELQNIHVVFWPKFWLHSVPNPKNLGEVELRENRLICVMEGRCMGKLKVLIQESVDHKATVMVKNHSNLLEQYNSGFSGSVPRK